MATNQHISSSILHSDTDGQVMCFLMLPWRQAQFSSSHWQASAILLFTLSAMHTCFHCSHCVLAQHRSQHVISLDRISQLINNNAAVKQVICAHTHTQFLLGSIHYLFLCSKCTARSIAQHYSCTKFENALLELRTCWLGGLPDMC